MTYKPTVVSSMRGYECPKILPADKIIFMTCTNEVLNAEHFCAIGFIFSYKRDEFVGNVQHLKVVERAPETLID